MAILILVCAIALIWVIGPSGGVRLPGGAIPSESGLYPPNGLADLDWQETVVAMTLNVVAQLVPPSANRVYLAIYPPTGGTNMSVGTRQANVSATSGRNVSATNPLIVTWSSDGPAVSQSWYGRPTATISVLVQQAFYNPKDRQYYD